MAGEGKIAFDLSTDTRPVDRIKKGFMAARREALQIVAREILTDTYAYVPVLTGALKDSGRIEFSPGFNDVDEVVKVIYGDDQTIAYAKTQHDDPYHHPSLGFYGRAAWFERVWALNGPYYAELFSLEFSSQLGATIR